MKETQPQRILIVDDEPLVCESVKMMLGMYGYKSQAVESGAEAIACLERERFDLMVTDYSMRGMKGDELSHIARKRWPHMGILMLTAYAAALDAQCFSSANAVLSKPCSAQELKDAVTGILAARRVDDLAAAEELARLQAAKNPPQAGTSPDAPRNTGK